MSGGSRSSPPSFGSDAGTPRSSASFKRNSHAQEKKTMRWQQVAASWPSFVQVISSRWSRLDPAKLAEMNGDRDRFEAHLSSSHDLTRAEAREAVEVWLIGGAPADLALAGAGDAANVSGGAHHGLCGRDDYPKDGHFGDDRLEGLPLGHSRQG
jgi:hypothetical protein